jgi:hypothetical protein
MTMGKQRDLHTKANTLISKLEEIVDQLKALGPDELDGNNALMNISEKLDSIVRNRMPRMW